MMADQQGLSPASEKSHKKKEPEHAWDLKMKALLGFTRADVSSFRALERLLCRPTDSAGLGVMRFMFGFLMMIDIWQERGLSQVAEEYANKDLCRFPLFNFLKPLPLVWMYMVYLILFIGELGIMLGLFYRLSCVLYIVCYWYIFLLDKMSWNNHSYLFGLCGILMLMVDGNRYWSLDGLLFKKKRHTHVPLWNYALLRFQIFIVYFIAGLKKLDMDWMTGYSMSQIADHYVFYPFRLILTEEQVSLFIVHLGGLTIDLFTGFLLFFDKTRKLGFLIVSSFHIMNFQLFSIGMFPWMMLATLSLFCYPNWPREIIPRCPKFLLSFLPADLPLQTSTHCIYSKKRVKPEEKQDKDDSCVPGSVAPPTHASRYHRLMVILTLLYTCLQLALPYSHGVTKGYNHWTQGLYGYSWDMMVHSWKLQHIKITYVNKETGEEGYLNPKAWTLGRRWSSHPDMMKQYASCVEERLAQYGLTNVELYIDVFRALNNRFQQRSFDPRVNILEAPWSPIKDTPWTLPLLVDLSDWRVELSKIEKTVLSTEDFTDVVFVADFPGLHLENFVQDDLGNTSVRVLKGTVLVELVDQGKNFTLNEGERMRLPAGQFHNIHTVSDTPSCYMYVFVNTTDVAFMEIVHKYDSIMNGTFTGTDEEAVRIKEEVEEGQHNSLFVQYFQDREKTEEKNTRSFLQTVSLFFTQKYSMLQRSIKFTSAAVTSLVTGASFDEFVNTTLTEEARAASAMLPEQYS